MSFDYNYDLSALRRKVGAHFRILEPVFAEKNKSADDTPEFLKAVGSIPGTTISLSPVEAIQYSMSQGNEQLRNLSVPNRASLILACARHSQPQERIAALARLYRGYRPDHKIMKQMQENCAQYCVDYLRTQFESNKFLKYWKSYPTGDKERFSMQLALHFSSSFDCKMPHVKILPKAPPGSLESGFYNRENCEVVIYADRYFEYGPFCAALCHELSHHAQNMIVEELKKRKDFDPGDPKQQYALMLWASRQPGAYISLQDSRDDNCLCPAEREAYEMQLAVLAPWQKEEDRKKFREKYRLDER